MNYPRSGKTNDRSAKVKELLFDNRRTVIKIGLILIVLAAALVVRINGSNSDVISASAADSSQETIEKISSAEEDAADADTAEEVPIYADISGAVKKPGVYQLEHGTRLFELIELAGGLSAKADIDAINQAAFIEDGEKIIIPVRGGDDTGQSDDSVKSGNASVTKKSGAININSADKQGLMEIPGVGEVIADRIIEYRKTSRFRKIDDIKNVRGIGDAKFEKMKEAITV